MAIDDDIKTLLDRGVWCSGISCSKCVLFNPELPQKCLFVHLCNHYKTSTRTDEDDLSPDEFLLWFVVILDNNSDRSHTCTASDCDPAKCTFKNALSTLCVSGAYYYLSKNHKPKTI